MITGYKVDRCPFCKATQSYLNIRRDPRYTQVRCGICGAEGPEAMSVDEAIDKWNRNTRKDKKE